MAKSLTASVGRMGGKNRPNDVEVVQVLLNKVPSHKGGPVQLLVVDKKCGPKTVRAIQKFQLHHFGWRGSDGRVDPNGPTHTKLNEFDDKRPTPSLPPPLTTRSQLICPHGGQVVSDPIGGSLPIKPIGGFLPIQPDKDSMVVGCPFTRSGGRPSPCIRVKWLTGLREPLTINSVGMCYSAEQVPQGRVRILRV